MTGKVQDVMKNLQSYEIISTDLNLFVHNQNFKSAI